jgi:hypothetical protein
MIDRQHLLADLKRLRRRLEDDFRRHHAAGPARTAVEAEWREAFDAKRTAETFASFFDAAFDQSAVHWILAAVFVRFLEDNRLIDRPILSGPGERLELARERQQAWFRARPLDSDAEYLTAAFSEMALLPGLLGLFDPAHNPLFRLPLSGDGAMGLFEFFRRVVPETGALEHDFTDPDWGTRWLGDLYQDLSEEARKRYALLQTPEFVEAYILDRTLEPAIREFGYEGLRMIDPACGSGHFLLGGFNRLLREWQRHAPGMPPAAQAQRALDSIAGVDLNPFAIEISRFRLLLAALQAAGETRLSASPDFRFQLAAGDSLLHGSHFARHELGSAPEGFRRLLRHHYAAEDTAELERILGRQYHAVVGNPPYITPKDRAMRAAYREIYESCYMKYALAVPFIERFFDLAQIGTREHAAGFVGMIVANSFMKREFGKRLIPNVLPRLDLTHVVDCSGAYIPGCGTPTAILFGRNRAPVASVVRAVMGIRGEPSKPDDPARGLVWSSIAAQTDQLNSQSAFVSVADMPRATLGRHPWSIGGGGAAELKELIETKGQPLGSCTAAIGVFGMTNVDEAMLADAKSFARARCESSVVAPLIVGDLVRDWCIAPTECVLFPYAEDRLVTLEHLPNSARWLWSVRTSMGNRATFAKRTYFAEGRPWWEWHQVALERLRGLTITFAFVATHNHFVLERGGKVFNRTAPIIKLAAEAREDDYLGLLGLLNSSTACFWMKQVLFNKGAGGGTRVEAGLSPLGDEAWENHYEHDCGKLLRCPVSSDRPVDLARALDVATQRLVLTLPAAVIDFAIPDRGALNRTRSEADRARAQMIALQEELDWRCYRLYGVLPEAPEYPDPPPINLGERAFEIVMARQIAAGELETAWFERHRSTPITKIPAHWPADYRAIVERRIKLIESNPNIALFERPEYKRRWSMPPWAEMEQAALRAWLLDRLEDPRYWPADGPRLVSIRQFSDMVRRDADFLAVAELYVGHADFELEALIANLALKESVPFLAPFRYTETGLRKRAQWEETWDKQWREDAIDAEVAAERDEFLGFAAAALHPRQEGETPEDWSFRLSPLTKAFEIQATADRRIAEEQHRRKKDEIGHIPVPPKYRTADFQSQDYWRLRGGLDVPKERFVSFPQCERDTDGSPVITWAGHDHLQRAQAIAAYYIERKERDGWGPTRLAPLLAGLREMLPWLRQWHNDYDSQTGLRMGDYFGEFVRDEARELGMTESEVANWSPPAAPRRAGRRRAPPVALSSDSLASVDDLL